MLSKWVKRAIPMLPLMFDPTTIQQTVWSHILALLLFETNSNNTVSEHNLLVPGHTMPWRQKEFQTTNIKHAWTEAMRHLLERTKYHGMRWRHLCISKFIDKTGAAQQHLPDVMAVDRRQQNNSDNMPP